MISVHTRLQKKKKKKRNHGEREREKKAEIKNWVCASKMRVSPFPRASQLLYYTVDLNIKPIATSTGAWARAPPLAERRRIKI